MILMVPDGWCIALRRILERYTPIIIGYEGNDGSLMGFLQTLPDNVPDQVFWCVYAPNAKPVDCVKRAAPEVLDFVRAHHGHLVPINGFDELMAKILSRLREQGSVPDLYERLKERARQRERVTMNSNANSSRRQSLRNRLMRAAQLSHQVTQIMHSARQLVKSWKAGSKSPGGRGMRRCRMPQMMMPKKQSS